MSRPKHWKRIEDLRGPIEEVVKSLQEQRKFEEATKTLDFEKRAAVQAILAVVADVKKHARASATTQKEQLEEARKANTYLSAINTALRKRPNHKR